jgi:hypothetical protein
MKRILAILAVVTVSVSTLASVVSFAQQTRQQVDLPVIIQQQIYQGPEGAGPPPPPGNTFIFVASEMGFGGKIVQGKPYSAEAVTETVQTLSDGNRIVNKTASTLYRDSEGRTRREQALKAIGSFANDGEAVQTIFINDPVAGVSYALDTRTKVAHRNSPLKLEQKLVRSAVGPANDAARTEHRFEYKIETKRSSMEAPAAPIGPGQVVSPDSQIVLRTEPGAIAYSFRTGADDKRVVKESLGRQLVEGVEAEGSRSTFTIPAGEIGNERDIVVISERWYSPDLQMVVMSKHSDPRFGETIYRLTNINRSEPAKSLFEVPPGFTVSEGFPGVLRTAPLPAKVKRPE